MKSTTFRIPPPGKPMAITFTLDKMFEPEKSKKPMLSCGFCRSCREHQMLRVTPSF